MQINRQRQKIYSSIEVDQNFAKSCQAYLVGLAVTDNPASLGTEMLLFSTEKKAEANSNELLEAMENMVEHSVELSRVVDGLSQDMRQLEEPSQIISTVENRFRHLANLFT